MRARRLLLQSLFVGFILFGTTQRAFAQVQLWSSYRNAGTIQFKAGNYAEAERLVRLALLTTESFNLGGSRVAMTLNDLGLIYEAQGRYSEAESVYDRASPSFKMSVAPTIPKLWWS